MRTLKTLLLTGLVCLALVIPTCGLAPGLFWAIPVMALVWTAWRRSHARLPHQL